MRGRSEVTTGIQLLNLMTNPDAPFIVTEFDMKELCFVTVSESARKILGYSPSEMIGHRFDEFIEPKTFDDNMEEVQKNKKLKDGTFPDLYPTVYISKENKRVVLVWLLTNTTKRFALCIGVPISINEINSILEAFKIANLTI